jgi:hypothetical protein
VIGELPEIAVALDELLDFFQVVLGHILFVAEVVALPSDLVLVDQVVHDVGVQPGRLEVIAGPEVHGPVGLVEVSAHVVDILAGHELRERVRKHDVGEVPAIALTSLEILLDDCRREIQPLLQPLLRRGVRGSGQVFCR